MKEKEHPYALRVPEAPWDKLVALAKSNHRSINMEIVVAIEDRLTKSKTNGKQTIEG